MAIVIILAIVLGGFLFWVAIPWLWAHVSFGGGLLLSGSLLVGTPVAPDGKVIQKQAPPAPVTAVAPAPQVVVAAPAPKPAEALAKPDCVQFNPPIVVSPGAEPDEPEFNPPVIVRPQRRR